MSSFDLRCIASVSDLLGALQELGGTISWDGEAPSMTARVGIDVSVDTQEAFEHIPSRWFEPDEPSLDPDPLDVRDFVGACLRGDRTVAAALLPRVVGPIGAQDAAERALQLGGRA